MKQTSYLRTEAKGFTLIELLVVIAIIGVLAAVVLLAINPAEMLRRGRDSTRMNDMVTLRKAIDGVFAQGGSWTATAGCVTAACASGTGTARAVDGTGYIPMVLNEYLSTLPADPRQGQTGSAINGVSAAATSITDTPASGFIYEFRRTGDLYEIRTMLESTNNWQRATTDGGDDNGAATTPAYFEVGTSLTIM